MQLFPQSCLPKDIDFVTQAQIDSFRINYPNCTKIEGDVLISESESGNITNLNSLSDLESIYGLLDIQSNSALENLSGLNSLKSIGIDLK